MCMKSWLQFPALCNLVQQCVPVIPALNDHTQLHNGFGASQATDVVRKVGALSLEGELARG